MGLLDGKVAIVTGRGGGVRPRRGAELAAQGAKVVVNDLGGSLSGEGADKPPGRRGRRRHHRAAAARPSPTTTRRRLGRRREHRQAGVDASARLDVLVNNAGILRDQMMFSMSQEDFDSVIKVHIKGTFNTMHHASATGATSRRKAASRAPRS